jgi:acyl-CoA hydrolase
LNRRSLGEVEHGVVNLENKTRHERAEAILSIAHPDFRSELYGALRERRLFGFH